MSSGLADVMNDIYERKRLAFGRAAYAAYSDEVDGLTHDGQPMPAWEDLGEKIQNAWIRAGQAGSSVL